MIQCSAQQVHIYDIPTGTGTVMFFWDGKGTSKQIVIDVARDVRYDVCLPHRELGVDIEIKPATYPYWECHLANAKAGTTLSFRDVCMAASLNARTTE